MTCVTIASEMARGFIVPISFPSDLLKETAYGEIQAFVTHHRAFCMFDIKNETLS